MSHTPVEIGVEVDLDATGPRVDPRLYGTFVEHMGRCVYQGIHEPDHPSAGPDGFRQDVVDLVAELGATVVRYPGGNFVSGFRWEDSVGPVDQRPVRLDPAWHSIEPHTVGLHEFAGWAARTGLELMTAVNLGTRGPAEAAQLLEYANHPGGTTLSDARRRNGAEQPFGIRTWCLGNEMDGPWQIGHSTAVEYGRRAAESARLMRMVDPSIELVAAGSSDASMPTFPAWDRTVAELTDGLVDLVSVHHYAEEVDHDLGTYLASGIALDRHLDAVTAVLDGVGARTPRGGRVGLAVDEWNVWYQRRWNAVDKPVHEAAPWARHPRLLEDTYSVTDAVVVGSLLMSLLRHADRVTVANLAQLVNVIAPIRTEPGGPAWRQTTFDPFRLTAAHARGRVVPTAVTSPTTPCGLGDVPVVEAVATVDDDRAAVLLLNRDPDRAADVVLHAAGPAAVAREAWTVCPPHGGDRHTVHGPVDQPVRARPLTTRTDRTRTTTTLPPLSWSVVVLTLSPGAHP